jgi:putative salt-induced outer membrane protein YdiY
MMRGLRYLVLLLVGTLASNASANWSGGLEAGTQLGSDESPALRVYLQNRDTPLSHYLYLDWIFESGSSRYRLGYNPEYTISQSVFSFGEFSIEQDDPGEIAREIDARAGIGNQIFRTKSSRLTLRTGIGGTRLKFADNSEQTDGYFFAGGIFTTRLIGLLKLNAVLESRVADSQTISSGEASISFRIGPNTSLKYAYTVDRFDFDEGREDQVNEDSSFAITYGF